MAQSTQAVLEHHLRAFAEGIDSVMEDFSESSVVITPESTYRGLDEIRGFFTAFIEGASEEFWGAFEMKRQEVVGELAYIVWEAQPFVALGTDTFIVRDGKFAFQTYAAHVPSS